ncbi:MAG: ERF family protein [Patescibacteria group bacterium]|nr:ERF family protein [Patescibacteria group bacterium]
MEKTIYKKILEAQKKIGAIKKGKTNPFFKSKYADINTYIDEVKPILNEVGLIILQPLTIKDGKVAIKTIIIDIDSGEEVGGIVKLPENPDPQKMGAIITYFRRYSIQSLLFLQAEDDDANSVSGEDVVVEYGEKECPICKKRHTGQYPKCLECWKSGKEPAKIKKIVNEEVEPF